VRTAAVTLVLLAFAGAASAASSAERVIARKSTSGDFAVAAAAGAATKPAALRVRITSSPVQPVQVTWKVTCKKGARSAVKRGQYRLTTSATRLVGFPMVKPDRCTVSASAQLEGQGMLTVTLLAR
jgi:hypothetical protein